MNLFSFPTFHRSTQTTENGERVEVGSGEVHTCSICWEQITEISLRLPCNHHFHENCIQTWLDRRSSCPICRRRVRDEEDDETLHGVIHITPSVVADLLTFKLKLIFIDPTIVQFDITTKWKLQDRLFNLFIFLDQLVHLSTTDYFIKIEDRIIRKNNSLNLLNTPISFFVRPVILSPLRRVEVYSNF